MSARWLTKKIRATCLFQNGVLSSSTQVTYLCVSLCVSLSLIRGVSAVCLCCHGYVSAVSFFLFHFFFPITATLCVCGVSLSCHYAGTDSSSDVYTCASVDITSKYLQFEMQGHSSRIWAGELGQMMIGSHDDSGMEGRDHFSLLFSLLFRL